MQRSDGSRVLQLSTNRFKFSNAQEDDDRVNGEGHAHLYIDRKKVGQIFSDVVELANPSSGIYQIQVGLFSNGHGPYRTNGAAMEQTIDLLIHKYFLMAEGARRNIKFALIDNVRWTTV